MNDLIVKQYHFICPLCHSTMGSFNNSLVCKNKHCFDISKKGYINFISNNSKNNYDKDLFINRRRILELGFYVPLLERIKEFTKDELRIIDVGCGEGFYISQLDNEIKYGLDIIKDAIIMASRDKTTKYLVASLTNIPLPDKSVDIVLNILTPADYKEFRRIANKIVKVIPGENYLKEIRELLNGELINKEYNNNKVVDIFMRETTIIKRERISYVVHCPKEEVLNFIKMTPLSFNKDLSNIPLNDMDITIDLEILVAKI